jgi:hypothetical protein
MNKSNNTNEIKTDEDLLSAAYKFWENHYDIPDDVANRIKYKMEMMSTIKSINKYCSEVKWGDIRKVSSFLKWCEEEIKK